MYTIERKTLTDIADAIREKTGKSGLLLPGDMPGEIMDINGDSVKTLMTKGQVSTNSNYSIAYFPDEIDFLIYNKLIFELYSDDKVVGHHIIVPKSLPTDFRIISTTGNNYYDMTLTVNSIACRYYRYDYVNLFIDILGIMI